MSILPEKEFKATVTKTLTQAKRNTVRTSTTTKNRKHKNNESEIKKQCMHAQSCPALCNPMELEPARLLCPWKFPGKECQSGLPLPTAGDLPNTGIETVSPALAGRFFITAPPRIITEMKNTLEGINTGNPQDWISNQEDRTVEMIQSELQKEKRIFKKIRIF